MVPLPREGKVASDVFRVEVENVPSRPNESLVPKASRKQPWSSSLGFTESRTMVISPSRDSLGFDHGYDVARVSFFPDGKWLNAAGKSCRDVLWDVVSQARMLDESVTPSSSSCVFLSLGLVLRVARASSLVTLGNARTLREVTSTADGNARFVSKSSVMLAVGTNLKKVSLLSLPDHTDIASTIATRATCAFPRWAACLLNTKLVAAR